MEQAERGGVLGRFLDLHMYITSALKKTDIKAVGLQMALDLLHAKVRKSRRSLISVMCMNDLKLLNDIDRKNGIS